MSASNAVPFSVYKAMICDMIHEETDERFIRQIYSIVLYQQKHRHDLKCGNKEGGNQ